MHIKYKVYLFKKYKYIFIGIKVLTYKCECGNIELQIHSYGKKSRDN